MKKKGRNNTENTNEQAIEWEKARKYILSVTGMQRVITTDCTNNTEKQSISV